MVEKNRMNCPYCGAPNIILIQKDGHDKLYKCEYCNSLWEYTKSGYISHSGRIITQINKNINSTKKAMLKVAFLLEPGMMFRNTKL